MGATPIYALPYPELADTPDVPRDIKALADAVDATFNAGQPMTVVKRAALLNLPQQVATVVPWDTEVVDELGVWTAGDPTALVIAAAGWYRIDAAISTGVTGFGSMVVEPQAKTGINQTASSGGGLGLAVTSSMPALLAVGDRVRMTMIVSVAGAAQPASMALTKL